MANVSHLPKWSTLDRRNALVDLFSRCRGFCVFDHPNCLIPEHHFELFSESIIKDWISDDREQRQAELIAEMRALHSFGERDFPLRGQFSAISKEIWGGSQPLFYIQNLGMSGVTLTPFAKVRVSSSYLRLYVDLGESLRSVGKCRRRKAIRYGKPLPKDAEARVRLEVHRAIKHYLDH